jgi:dihydrofolate reductase
MTTRRDKDRPELVALIECDEQGGISRQGEIPWHFPVAKERRRRLTLGHSVIMGRFAFEHNPPRLSYRKNIVLTSSGSALTEVATASTIDEALRSASGTERAFVVGGASVFCSFADLTDRYEIACIPGDYDCDIFVVVAALTEGFDLVREELAEDGIVFLTYQRSLT